MGFKLPTFNLECFIWRAGGGPGNPIDVHSNGNLCLGRRVYTTSDAITPSGFVRALNPILLLPKLTDVRDSSMSGGPDVVEVPGGSGRVYNVQFVEDAGKGFSNEHRVAVLSWAAGKPAPLP
jgi:hypothetical protein